MRVRGSPLLWDMHYGFLVIPLRLLNQIFLSFQPEDVGM